MSLHTSRTIAAPPSRVFAAFADASRLAAWWGPDGFTNTFDAYAFERGGRWVFTMHGPDGKSYPNEIVVLEIEPAAKVVLNHVTAPRFVLTVTFEPAAGGGTLVGWTQTFETPDVERSMESLARPANEQVLDRLAASVIPGARG